MRRLRAILRARRVARLRSLRFAEVLHRSSAWHCGCSRCRGVVLGVKHDTLRLTEEEAARLRVQR